MSARLTYFLFPFLFFIYMYIKANNIILYVPSLLPFASFFKICSY